ncbi:MAG: hypothetical protein HFH10_05265 [Dorea sp.]|nr:hypothetical protein [Dorea sp.]
MGLRNLKEIAEDRAKEKERHRREKERKKSRNFKHGQVKLKHSKRGLVSSGLAFTSAFLMMLIFLVSYISRGDVDILIGFTGLMVLVMSAVGVEQGIKGYKEREKNYVSCKGGIICNVVLLLIFTATFIRGFF